MKCLIVVFIVVAVAGYVKGNYELETADKKYILDEHNRVRNESGASNMYKLVWNSALAATMQTLVGTCKFEHSPDAGRYWGENIAMLEFPKAEYINYFSSTVKIDYMVTKGFNGQSWFEEKQYVADTSFTCAWVEGEKTCGHYTQMLWADSTQLGCAAIYCPDFQYKGKTKDFVWFLACAYTTAGNVENHKAFETGDKCTACKSGDTCEGNLCIAA